MNRNVLKGIMYMLITSLTALYGCGGDNDNSDTKISISAPLIESIPDQKILQGETYRLTPSLSKGENIFWLKEYGPDEVIVDRSSGKVTWDIPADLPSESFHIGIKAINENTGEKDIEIWILTVGSQDVVYVGPTGTYTNLKEAFASESTNGGVTIIVQNGDYSDLDNYIGLTGPGSIRQPPNGNSSGFTTLMAEDVGRVTLKDEARNVEFIGAFDKSEYIAFKGFFLKDGKIFIFGDENCTDLCPNHIKVVNNGVQADENSAISASRSQDILIEGNYVFGGGRYKVLAYLTDRVVMRRNIARIDRAPEGTEPKGAFVLYSVNEAVVQNSIDIDSDFRGFWDEPGSIQNQASFMTPVTAGDTTHVEFSRIMTLNNKMRFMNIGKHNCCESLNISVKDAVGWDIETRDAISVIHTFGETTYENMLIGHVSPEYDLIPYLMNGWGGSTQEVKNSVFFNANSEEASFFGIEVMNYNNFYNILGTGGEINPQNTLHIDPSVNSLKYLPKIETGSDLSGAGEGGVDIGPRIMTYVGKSGTFYGEDGYNNETGISMWPFPGEDLIKEKMSEYFYSGTMNNGASGTLSGVRGFAAPDDGVYGGPITLTSYIWEYLGNTCPPDICDYGRFPE